MLNQLLTDQKLFEKIENQHIIVDSCIWLQAYNHTELFDPLFFFFSGAGCRPVTIPEIYFEVLGRVPSNEDYERMRQFVATRVKSRLFETGTNVNHQDIVTKALEIARIYKRHGITNPSFVDCYIAAAMAKYLSGSSKVFLVTENHKDFPPLLFDQISVLPVNLPVKKTDWKIYTPVIYEMKKEAYEAQVKKINE